MQSSPYWPNSKQLGLGCMLLPHWKLLLPLKIHIPVIFSSENYYSDCIAIAKTFLDLAEGTMILIFLWQDVATDCVRPKTNTTPFEMTRQDKISHWANIPENTAAGQPGWSTEDAEM